jgi:hypothetical protein
MSIQSYIEEQVKASKHLNEPTMNWLMEYNSKATVYSHLKRFKDFFVKIYTKKLEDQIKEAIYNHVFGNVLLSFMEDIKNLEFDSGKWVWSGSSTDLYSKTKIYAKDVLLVSTRTKSFPVASNLMSRQINELSDAFSKIGIELQYDRNATARGWTIINHNLPPPKIDIDKLLDDPKKHCARCGKELKHERYPDNERKKWYCRECNEWRMSQK